LDVTIEAQILSLMKELQKQINTSIIMITHNLGVVAEICDDVYVMYAGKIVETTDVFELFEKPLHPYTNGLMNSIRSTAARKIQDYTTSREWSRTFYTCREAAGSAPDARRPWISAGS